MGDARPLGEVIANLMSTSGLGRRCALRDASTAWQEAAGKDAAHSRIVAVKKGVAHVLVDSAACLHELANFRKKEILAGLQNHKNIGSVHDITFRLGSLEQR